MDLIKAQRIVDDWNQYYWPGRVKTSIVKAAEDYLDGKHTKEVTIKERHHNVFKEKRNEEQRQKRRSKTLRRFLVNNTGSSSDVSSSSNISSSSDLDAIQNKHFRAIVEVVSGNYRFNVSEIMGESRSSELAFARALIVYLAVYYGIGELRYIGSLIRRKGLKPMDHSTVIHARNTIIQQIQKEPKMKALINQFMDHINMIVEIETMNFNSFDL